MAPGRKPEQAPEGMMTPAEAAKVLNRTPETVKGYIRDGTLMGSYDRNESGEIRYYASTQAVHAMARERMQTDLMVKRAGELHGKTQERLIEEIRLNREVIGEKLDRLIESREEQTRILEDAAAKEKEHQERTREHEKRISDFLDRFEERQGKGWWSRLFR